jgi:hypothetical protein
MAAGKSPDPEWATAQATSQVWQPMHRSGLTRRNDPDRLFTFDLVVFIGTWPSTDRIDALPIISRRQPVGQAIVFCGLPTQTTKNDRLRHR